MVQRWWERFLFKPHMPGPEIGYRRLTRKKRLTSHWTPRPLGLCATGQDSVITNYLKGFILTAAKFVIHILPQKYVLEFYESLFFSHLRGKLVSKPFTSHSNLINSILSPTVEGVISLPAVTAVSQLFCLPRPPFCEPSLRRWSSSCHGYYKDRNIVVL
jgi:hypothetical protein